MIQALCPVEYFLGSGESLNESVDIVRLWVQRKSRPSEIGQLSKTTD